MCAGCVNLNRGCADAVLRDVLMALALGHRVLKPDGALAPLVGLELVAHAAEGHVVTLKADVETLKGQLADAEARCA